MRTSHRLSNRFTQASATLVLGFTLSGCSLFQSEPEIQPQAKTPDARPVLPIMTADTMRLVCDAALREARERVDNLANVSLSEVPNLPLLESWDRDGATLENALNPVYLLTYVHPDKAVRDVGQQCIVEMTKFSTEVYQNEAVYKRIRAIEPTDAIQTKLKQDIIDSFEDQGVTLSKAKRKRAAEISARISELSQAFQKNLRDNSDTITFTEAEVAGVPEAWKTRNRDEESPEDAGTYTVGFDYPDYGPFMANADDAAARKRYMIGYYNRGGEQNIAVLDEIMQLRAEVASLHGLESYAALVTKRRMVENPATVTAFLDEVAAKVRDVELRDIDALRAVKAETTGTPISDTNIQRWDVSYYQEQLRQQRYAVDQEALREYFPMPATIDWVLHISQTMYGLTIVEADVPVWHPEVKYYDVYDAETDQFIGGFYLDLYPRDGKYTHAAAFGVRSGSTSQERTPISVLVTNFDRNGLTHRELETLFHEFGHVLHGVLSHTRYTSHAGTSVMRDFVEAPSQMYEAWARRPESLQTIKEVCDDCKVLDDDLLERVNAARLFGKGLFYARQHLYASYDMALANAANPEPALQVWQRMESATPVGHLDGTMFPSGFGHIAGGYAAGYYGYMWSEVLALDMLSAFGDNVMQPAIGKRYRKEILERGGEKHPRELVEGFLGRASKSDAFFEEVGGGDSE